jgi:hypothetical protein
MAASALHWQVGLATLLGLAVGCARQERPKASEQSRQPESAKQPAAAKSPADRDPAAPTASAGTKAAPSEPARTVGTSQRSEAQPPPAAAGSVQSTAKADAQPPGMTLAEARAQLDRARKSAQEGNAARGFKLATECWNEARARKGDPQWDAFGPQRADPTDSTTLILK